MLLGVFVTALYSFRLVFMTFHGRERMDEHTREHLHESPWVVTLPLIALAIPSIAIGWLTVGPVVFGGFFSGAHRAGAGRADRPARRGIPRARRPSSCMRCDRPRSGSRCAGIVAAWYLYLKRPDLPDRIAARFSRLYRLLVNKYYFDWFNENVVATRRAELRHQPLEAGRRDRHRRLARQWQRARDRRAFRPSFAKCSRATSITMPSR